ncbi:sodium:solute symporter family protein [Fulvivirgaceae bacterium BMA10]|uniref:Sodium:solute symporter family protein n=1 Tax=Splendidivirga corallicola TaxID=3051826 RepID=A0ABT8KHU3_9BACT|nr:sodium:solute symporter family protein [Fulvivirgaceae bacterium BMA10]
MTNFNWYIDGSIILLYLAGTITAGLWVRKYVRKVDDFLVAGRSVNLYLGIASLSATEFGIATCMANAELGYKYGFAGITPGIALAAAMFIIGWTGFCIKPLREQKVITLPELFENKFGEKVRWASGVVIVLGGLLNMGVFLRQAGDYLAIVCGFDPIYLELIMTAILIGIAIYTILGGMLSVLVTDYIQFVVMSIGLIAVVGLLIFTFGWNEMIDSSERLIGEGAFNPFFNGEYGVDRILLDLFLAFASVLTWQTMISRVLAAKDSTTGQKIYKGTSPFFLVRFSLPALLGIAALHYFGSEGIAVDNEILAMPNLLALVIPVGLIGILVAAMLAADMSTNSSYLIAWSSVIYNDIMRPIHKGLWSDKKGLLWNRILIGFIGIFLLLYGLWYPMKGDLWVYLQVTGTIYLASMSVILIAACYWKKANNWGAIAAIVTGCIIPVGFLILQQVEATQEQMAAIGPYKIGVATYLMTALAMWLGSIAKHYLSK